MNAAHDKLFEIFHTNTKYTRTSSLTDALRMSAHTNVDTTRNTKVFRYAPRLRLPTFSGTGTTLESALSQRVSTRVFSGAPLTLQALANILLPAAAAAQANVITQSTRARCFRTYPSAGATYPLEIYVFLLRAADTPCAIMHFDPQNRELSILKTPAEHCALSDALILAQTQVETAAAFMIITALFERTTLKYGNRGYRFVLLEAGHLAQNLCLSAAAAGWGSLTWGGFHDDHLHRLVGVDGVNEAAVHCLFIGGLSPPESTPST